MRLSTTQAATTVAASAALVAVGLATAPTATADEPLAPKTTFTMVVDQATGTVPAPADGAAIPNIDSVKSTIRAYYNASKKPNPVDPSGPQVYTANLTSSRYADNVRAIERSLLRQLPAVDPSAHKAVVFDVDATLLLDYAFEEATNFNYDGTVNAAWVNAGAFPAVPGMPALVRTLKARGYDIFGITGRPETQEDATLANLAAEGFTEDGAANGTPLFTGGTLYTKWLSGNPIPSYIDTCTISPNCNTVEYKGGTRRHLETDLGEDIVMSVGDQWSDLEGGYADDTQKIPNPTYFLAAQDIAGAPVTDRYMVPPTTYVMAPDGSSGYGVATGDEIPNLDPLRKEIRAYYNAPAGIADKTSSPYIAQLTQLETDWSKQITSDCQAGAQAVATAKATIAAAQQAVVAADKSIAAADKALARADRALRHARRHHRVAKVRKALRAKRAALAARSAAVADRAAANRVIASTTVPGAPAAIFDADDTTLWTYDMEDAAMKFAFNPVLQNTWVQEKRFAAVPGMAALVKAVKSAGCAVVGLTGRGTAQQDATIANLTEKGYTAADGSPLFTAGLYFTKPSTMPSYVDCGSDRVCSTIEYKSGTRAHVETMGYDVVANLGDQFSDLLGGHADHTYKLPNPTYYLP